MIYLNKKKRLVNPIAAKIQIRLTEFEIIRAPMYEPHRLKKPSMEISSTLVLSKIANPLLRFVTLYVFNITGKEASPLLKGNR